MVRGKIHCMLLQKTRAGAVPLSFHGSIKSPESRSFEIAIPEEGRLVLLQIDTLNRFCNTVTKTNSNMLNTVFGGEGGSGISTGLR